MIFARKPIEIIAETLRTASDDVFEVSEDIIADLERAGWHFAWAPDRDVEDMRHLAA
jgi:hypothetical protein